MKKIVLTVFPVFFLVRAYIPTSGDEEILGRISHLDDLLKRGKNFKKGLKK